MGMDISQYKDLFITEAQEHLDAMNKFLLELENEPGNLDVVTEIFRSAHTLKGMSATMGYDQLTELAHEMENLLEQLRAGDAAVTARVVEVLFACFDTLGEIIDAIAGDRSQEIDFSGLVLEIRAIAEAATTEKRAAVPQALEEPVSAETPPEEPSASTGKAAVEPPAAPEPEDEEPRPSAETGAGVLELGEQDMLKYSAMAGMRILRVTVELSEECLLKSVRVFMVFKKLAQFSDVIGSLPSAEVLEDEKFDSSFQVAIATREASERVEKSLLAIAEIACVTCDVVHEPKQEARTGEIPATQKSGGRADPIFVARKTQSVRVNIARLDTLMNLVGEIVINRTRLAQIASSFDIPELREALDQTARLTAELREEVMKTRMVPVEHVFSRFPRMVRDLAMAQNKEIDFVVEGKEIELDRTILDEISDPLIHMIRNAIDHGIASPEKRRQQGKPACGTVKLSAYRDRNYVAIEIEDDGEGIQPTRVFDRALQKGLVTADERRALTEDDVLRVLCLPGFSMSDQVSDVSGRGVGMDAVKSRAESLGGFVLLSSEPGQGTRMTLKLPLTLAIVHALMVEVAGETYAVPLGTVRETHIINPDEIKTAQNHEAIFLRDETIPLLRLDRALGCSYQLNGAKSFPVVIVETGPRLVALGVHSLLGQQEIVINVLDKFLKRIEGFAGATILGTGRIALILDVPNLM
ncbi:MAG: chemotaxis protein CheA [Candidatus Anoxymicrobium japonicum]|uniref:Chemotaxis protein CheA n=1 Tax=Candidatus Anoxymicrobium japonicum TaxID=2013648 RepID=A0A2N3G4L5_9ACTN|nr:MAG: chemotaxis protein CheA [Candidatus Anoxymicrobium japonicum]